MQPFPRARSAHSTSMAHQERCNPSPSAHVILEIADSDADASTTADSILVSPAKWSAPRAFLEVMIPKVRVKKEKDTEPEKVKVKGKKPEIDGLVHTLPPLSSTADFFIGSQS
jgi:hypothetical protein